MGVFHLYRGGTATLISFVRVSEEAGHVIEEGNRSAATNQRL